jgi:holin-like protein
MFRALRLIAGVAALWAFAQAGALLAGAAGLPVPGSVIGMLLLWAALATRVLRLEWIDSGARSLLRILGLLFVPAGVGFVQFAGAGSLWLEVGAVVVAGTLVTLAITGHVVQRAVGRDA